MVVSIIDVVLPAQAKAAKSKETIELGEMVDWQKAKAFADQVIENPSSYL